VAELARGGGALGLPLALAGGYWYLRNFLETGNPMYPAPFLGLPGNPVAAMLTFLFFARVLLLRLGGGVPAPPRHLAVRAGFAYRKKAGRREWVRATLRAGADGIPEALKFPREGAGVLSSVVESDGLIELDEATTTLTPGTLVPFLPFAGLMD
jgi:molybdopterin molybdotransferase